MYFTYILFSQQKNKYYIGHTGDDLSERIRRHNTDHRGFTGGVGDWSLVYQEAFQSKTEAFLRTPIARYIFLIFNMLFPTPKYTPDYTRMENGKHTSNDGVVRGCAFHSIGSKVKGIEA